MILVDVYDEVHVYYLNICTTIQDCTAIQDEVSISLLFLL